MNREIAKDEDVIIIHNISGLHYGLTRKDSDKWYLSANDGRVPSGQIIHGDNLSKVLRGINCSLISE